MSATPAPPARDVGVGSSRGNTAIGQGPSASSLGNETINTFLDRQAQQLLIRLYQRPANCLSIFRLLPLLSRTLLMSLLFLPPDQPLSVDDARALLKKTATDPLPGSNAANPASKPSSHWDEALKRLDRLSILREKSGKLWMNGVWSEGLRRALIGGGNHRSFGVPCATPDEGYPRVTAAFLDHHARTKWESILHYMVRTPGYSTPSDSVVFLLRQSGLIGDPNAPEGSGPSTATSLNPSALTITSRGFQFLLEDLNTQLWDLLLSYLNLSTLRSMDLVEVLSFVFMLGSLSLGQDYSVEDLEKAGGETALHMLDDFQELGLVYMREQRGGAKKKSGAGGARSVQVGERFWPTRLATTLTNLGGAGAGMASALGKSAGGQGGATGAGGEAEEEGRGFVILETNYRVYAYTSNELRISVLSLFVDIRTRFPNLITGIINRDSIKRALRSGITSEQIIAYLGHHAHPQMRRNDPLLPVTVTDQIRLWERERNRVTSDEGSLYTGFSSTSDFALVRDYASQLGVLLWQNEQRRSFFVAAEGNEPVRDFIRRRLV